MEAPDILDFPEFSLSNTGLFRFIFLVFISVTNFTKSILN